MSDPDCIFLSPEEAIAAICFDFCQYPPQTRLFLELCPIILGPETPVVADSRCNGLWVSISSGRRRTRRMKKITPGELGHQLLQHLRNAPPSAEKLADICSLVFRTQAAPGTNGSGANPGIWISTQMETFHCRQCGRCCRDLDYRHEINESDYRLWQQTGRSEILERVAIIAENDRIISYAIWVAPGTRRFADVCPWLEKVQGQNRWICRIHEVKPEICRQYPCTRKHAEMTGCIGFTR